MKGRLATLRKIEQTLDCIRDLERSLQVDWGLSPTGELMTDVHMMHVTLMVVREILMKTNRETGHSE